MAGIKKPCETRSETVMFLHLEIRPMLSSATVYILNCGSEKISIKLERNKIIVLSGNKTRSVTLNNVEIAPNTCSNLQHLNNGLCFRIQIKLIKNTGDSNQTLNEMQPFVRYAGKCVFCDSSVIYDDTVFERILPLPSSDALSESGNWFCCQHSTPTIPLLHPRDKDILYTEEFVTVNSKVVDLCSIIVDNKNNVKCKRCASVLGKTKPGNADHIPAFKFYKFSIIFKPSSENNEFVGCDTTLIHYNKILSGILLGYHKNMTSKFVISNKLNRNHVILIWVSCVGNFQVANYFDQENVELTPEGCLKLLYVVVNTKDEICKHWESDPAVEVLSFCNDFHINIVRLLIQKTNDLPSILRKLDKFWVCYL